MAKDHGPSIKDDEQCEKLRKKGESKGKAARIANTGRSGAGKRGGKSGSIPYGYSFGLFHRCPALLISPAQRLCPTVPHYPLGRGLELYEYALSAI